MPPLQSAARKHPIVKKTQVIMLMESNHEDIYLLQQAFQKAKIANTIKIVRHSDEAILYLRGVGVYANRADYPVPSLLCIDLTSATRPGLDLISWVRNASPYPTLPIIVFVATHSSTDLQVALDYGANSYVLKGGDQTYLADMVKRLEVSDALLWRGAQAANEAQVATPETPAKLN